MSDKELVERLRSVDQSWSEVGEWCGQAADRIETLAKAAEEGESWRAKALKLEAELAARDAPAAVPDGRVQWPKNWKISPGNAVGTLHVINIDDGSGCMVSHREEHPRVIPSQILYDLCAALLAAAQKEAK